MFCQAGFDQWLTTIMQHLSHLSKPQATVLALWSFGMVLARSCALSAVSHLLAEGMQRKEQTVRQQLREWYYDAQRKRGTKRQALQVETCFAALLGWVVSWWQGTQLALALDATTLGPALCGPGRQCGLSRLCHPRGLGDPAGQRQTRLAARMAAAVAPAAPGHPPGLDGDRAWPIGACMRRGCFGASCAWAGIRFCASTRVAAFGLQGRTCWRPLKSFVPQPGTSWRGTGLAFTRNQVPCTLAGALGGRLQRPLADPDRSAAGGQ